MTGRKRKQQSLRMHYNINEKRRAWWVLIKFRPQKQATDFHFNSDIKQTNKACSSKPQLIYDVVFENKSHKITL